MYSVRSKGNGFKSAGRETMDGGVSVVRIETSHVDRAKDGELTFSDPTDREYFTQPPFHFRRSLP